MRMPTSDHFTLRPARSSDARSLAPLMTSLGYPSSAQDMERRMRAIAGREDFATWIAELDGSVAGMVGACVAPYYERNGHYARVLAIVVDERFRGQGLGALLLGTAEDWARARGAGAVIVNSGNQRHRAHAFYRDHGYENTGVRFVKNLSAGDRASD